MNTATRPVIIGVDPGTKGCAVVGVLPAPGRRVLVCFAKEIAPNFEGFDEVLEACPHPIAAVAIEWAQGFAFAPYRVPPLLAAQGNAGEFSGAAKARGLRVMKACAQDWRRDVVGNLKKGQKYDRLIEAALTMFVAGSRTFMDDVHRRDAAGIAYWASTQVWKSRGA